MTGATPAERERDPARPAPGAAATPDAAERSAASSEVRPAPARDRRPEGPRRVRGGIKLRARDGIIPSTPLSDAILERLQTLFSPDELAEGLRYARLGQVASLERHAGGVLASVQGRSPRRYETKLVIGTFAAADWERITEAMAAEAGYLVKLLAGGVPAGLDTLLARLGLTLLPDAEALGMECTCGAAHACRHAAAVGYLLAEQLADTPAHVFTLRGLEPDRLLEGLRQERMLQARGVASAHADPMIPESLAEPPPLELCVDEFWRPGARLAEMRHAPPARHVSHALLRRLGPSPVEGKFPLVGLLASIYDAVAAYAVSLRDRAEGVDAAPGDDDG